MRSAAGPGSGSRAACLERDWEDFVVFSDFPYEPWVHDFVAAFQDREDAERFRQELEERLAAFELQVAPEKMRAAL